MLTIIAAMEEELAGVRTALAAHGRDRPGAAPPSPAFGVIGVGRDGLESGLRGLLPTLRQQRLGAEPPSELLLLGFAGGVDPSLSTGDLTLAGRYCRLAGDQGVLLRRVPDGMTEQELERRFRVEMASRDPALPPRAVLKFLEPDPAMLQRSRDALAQGGLTAVETDSMTVPELVTNTNTKRELHRQYQVGTVNMEDYWVARLAAAAKVPLLSVRAVLDTAGQGLPPYLPERSGSAGWASFWPTMARPWRFRALLGLSGQMRLAQASLARFALAYVRVASGQ